jgi:hypothetical protein
MQQRLVLRRRARGCSDGLTHLLERDAAPQRQAASAGAPLRLEHDAIVAGAVELVGGAQAAHAAAIAGGGRRTFHAASVSPTAPAPPTRCYHIQSVTRRETIGDAFILAIRPSWSTLDIAGVAIEQVAIKTRSHRL